MKYLLLLIALVSVDSYGWEDIDKEIAVLNTDIRHIWSGGSWEHQDRNGFYRIIIAGGGYEHYKTKMYVQWVLHGSDMQAPTILETAEISELNMGPLYAFDLPTCLGGWECGTVEIEATHTYELSTHIFRLKFLDIGKYQIEKQNLEQAIPLTRSTNKLNVITDTADRQ